MRLSDIMTATLETTGAEQSIREACKKMASLGVGVLPVVENDRAVGIVTDRDIVCRGLAAGVDVDRTPIRDVMTRDMWCLPQDRDVEEAAQLMEERQIRRILVLNDNGQITGIISLGDLAVRNSNQHLSGEVIERISEPTAPTP